LWTLSITGRVRCPGRRRRRRPPHRAGTPSTTASSTMCRSHAGSHCSTRRRHRMADARHDATKQAPRTGTFVIWTWLRGNIELKLGRVQLSLSPISGSPALLLLPFPLASQRRLAHRFGCPQTRRGSWGSAHQSAPAAAADTEPRVAHSPTSKSA